MTNPPPKLEIAKAMLKQSLTNSFNRCQSCGRRLKYQPGAWITSTGERFTTCRSCGFENPSRMEKVAEALSAAGYDVFEEEGVLGLPQCLDDGSELQVSKDFTKVFCFACGREWERFAFEDIMGEAISPQLAGAIPLNRDDSEIAQKLEHILDDNDFDSGTPFYVVQVYGAESEGAPSVGKELLSAFKQGWKEGKSGSKEVSKQANSEEIQFLAVYEDGISYFIWDGTKLAAEQKNYSELFQDPADLAYVPFDVKFSSESVKKNVIAFLECFKMIHFANSKPFEVKLFGAAAREALEKSPQHESSPTTSMADELSKLADLHTRGLLTLEEFQEAKAKLIQRS
jgi:hypothetical protein